MDEVRCKIEFLLGMLREPGELYLSEQGKRGLYSFLSGIGDDLAAENIPLPASFGHFIKEEKDEKENVQES